MAKLVMASYCGIYQTLCEGTISECRDRAKRRILWFKKVIGGEVSSLSPSKWELSEPDNSTMVPDECGILSIHS